MKRAKNTAETAARVPPKTVEESLDILLQVLDRETMESFAGRSEKDLKHYHCTAALLIHKEFNLEKGNPRLVEDCRRLSGKADLDGKGAAIFILETLWASLQKTRH